MLEEGDSTKDRRSLRLPEYNYSQAGAYFVTICTDSRRSFFGTVIQDQMCLNDLGRLVEAEWLRTPSIRSQVHLDAFVVMPNHLHGILVIDDGANETTGSEDGWRMQDALTPSPGRFRAPSQTIGAIIRGFKGAATNQISGKLRQHGIVVWQRNYYEHIIRDEAELSRIQEYIAANPAMWAEDKENPDR